MSKVKRVEEYKYNLKERRNECSVIYTFENHINFFSYHVHDEIKCTLEQFINSPENVEMDELFMLCETAKDFEDIGAIYGGNND